MTLKLPEDKEYIPPPFFIAAKYYAKFLLPGSLVAFAFTLYPPVIDVLKNVEIGGFTLLNILQIILIPLLMYCMIFAGRSINFRP